MRCWIVRIAMGLLFSLNNATKDLTRFVCYTLVTEFISLAQNIFKVTCCQSKAFVCYGFGCNTKILINKCAFSTHSFTVLSSNKIIRLGGK